LRPWCLSALSCVCFLLSGCVDIPADIDIPLTIDTDVTGIDTGSSSPGAYIAQLETHAQEKLNALRLAAGVASLPVTRSLGDVARAHSLAMLTGGFFSHEDLQGRSPQDRLAAARISYDSADELIGFANTQAGVSASDVDAILEELASQRRTEERAILMSPTWTEMGAGIALSDSQRVLFLTIDLVEYPPRVIGVD